MPWTITADSTPVLDGWGSAPYWGPTDWVSWFYLVKQRDGAEIAKRRFLASYFSASWLAASYDWKIWNTPFREFLKREDLYAELFGGFTGWIDKIVASVIVRPVEVGSTVIEEVGGAAESTAKTVHVLIPVIIVLALAAAGYWVWINYLRTK